MFGKNFKLSLAITSIYFLMIASIGKYYRDDYFRIVEGNFRWDVDGRPLANLIIKIMNVGSILTDVSPRAQIFAAIIFALACAIIGTKIIKSSVVINVLCSSLLIFSPFFIQNLLYSFDTLSMSIAMLLCAAPFLLNNKNRVVLFGTSLLCVTMSLSTYQAMMPLFFILNFVHLLSSDITKDKAKNALLRIFACCLALIIYKLFIANAFVTSSYALKTSQLLIPTNADDFALLQNSMKILFHKLSLVYNLDYLIYYIPAAALALTYLLKTLFIYRKLYLELFTVVLTMMSSISSSFIYFFLTKPEHHVRIFVGFGSLLFVLSALSIFLLREKKNLSYIAFIPPLFLFTSIANDYIVAQKAQFKFEKQVVESIHQDYLRANASGNIEVFGKIPFTDQALRGFKKTPLLVDFMNFDFTWWSGNYFAYTELPMLKKIGININKDPISKSKFSCDKPVFKYNGVYSTYVDNGKFIVNFSSKC